MVYLMMVRPACLKYTLVRTFKHIKDLPPPLMLSSDNAGRLSIHQQKTRGLLVVIQQHCRAAVHALGALHVVRAGSVFANILLDGTQYPGRQAALV